MNADLPQELWDHELATISRPAADWLWHGFLARGNITLLTGMNKCGKTTLLTLLLARRRGGGSLAGLAVAPGKTVVVTEEDPALWAERARRHDFGGNACFLSRPFLTVPRPDQWHALLTRVARLREEHGADLLVLDPLAPLLPCENNPRSVLETLLPLTELTRRGMAVLALHHPAKGPAALGLAARGSGALLGHVDISIELRHPGGDPLTRRRRCLALSRHADTPRQLLLELVADGTDYRVLAEQEPEDGFQLNWDVLRLVLEDAPQKLTRADVLGEWPADYDPPSHTALRKWLDRAVDRGLVAREGSGRKADPFRYWLPAREEVWKQDFLYEMLERQRQELRLPFQSLTERKRIDAEAERDRGGWTEDGAGR